MLRIALAMALGIFVSNAMARTPETSSSCAVKISSAGAVSVKNCTFRGGRAPKGRVLLPTG